MLSNQNGLCGLCGGAVLHLPISPGWYDEHRTADLWFTNVRYRFTKCATNKGNRHGNHSFFSMKHWLIRQGELPPPRDFFLRRFCYNKRSNKPVVCGPTIGASDDTSSVCCSLPLFNHIPTRGKKHDPFRKGLIRRRVFLVR